MMQNIPMPNTASALRGWAMRPSRRATPPTMAAIGTAQSQRRPDRVEDADLLDRQLDRGHAADPLVAGELDELGAGDLDRLGALRRSAGRGRRLTIWRISSAPSAVRA